MGRLERRLDVDLINKMQPGWKPHREPEPLKKQKPPRPASTYRAARRNALRSNRGYAKKAAAKATTKALRGAAP